MIISRTPYRISFFGGGTDYPAWFEQHGGEVLSTTINKYSYISCRILPPFFEHKSRIVCAAIQNVFSNDDIEHPIVKAVLKNLEIKHGVVIHHDGDLPSRSGLGSSSSFTVGLYNALFALQSTMISKQELAKKAIYTEKVLLNEEVGVQDQIAASFGGLNKIEIKPDHTFSVVPIVLSKKKLEIFQKSVMLFYTGVSRTASHIAKEKVQAFFEKSKNLHAMKEMVAEAINILTSAYDSAAFGKLLHESWLLKKNISKNIAPSFVDDIYEKAIEAGAYGGKLLGAGGGGFMMFIVDPALQPSVLSALDKLLYVPVEFESSGSQIIFYQNEVYSNSAMTDGRFIHYDNNQVVQQKRKS